MKLLDTILLQHQGNDVNHKLQRKIGLFVLSTCQMLVSQPIRHSVSKFIHVLLKSLQRTVDENHSTRS